MFVPLSVSALKEFPLGTPWIVIPFRDNAEQDRANQLKRFVSHMTRYHPDWHVLIIEQSDDGRKFNRGALLNIGARYAHKQGAKYIIFHDVDLLPLAPIVPYYEVYPSSPIHIGKAWVDKYDYERFFGGVVSISMEDLQKSNGFPNQFWGWGGEDDALRERLNHKGIQIYQPVMRHGFRELPHVNTSTKKEWTNLRKRADVMGDTGRMGFRTIQWTPLEEEKLSPSAKKYTVELK